jgi:ketosteroid isomerase-like protein
MSEENVELVLRLYDAWNRRHLDGFLELTHEDVVVESRLAAMECGYRGHEGTRRWWADLHDVIPDHTVEVEELRDLGDITLAHLRARGHGAASDAPLVEVFWQPVRWRDGKIIWWRLFSTEAEALEAIGLSE